jgi:ABC-type polysaccharide/polyol phosphate export permease
MNMHLRAETQPLEPATRKRVLSLFSVISFYSLLIHDFAKQHRLLMRLGLKELRSMNSGAALGRTWLFLEPFIYSAIMWFFFTKAIAYRPAHGGSYIAWLMPSMFVWYFLSNSLSNSANVLRSYSYFFRQRQFNIALLPLISVFSSLYVHLIFVGILIGILILSHTPITFYWLQSTYYMFAASVFVYAVSLFTSSFSLFIKDVRNIIAVVLQLLFWVSPIFWDVSSQPDYIQTLVKLNPLFHIVMGYRYSFVYGQPFWTDLASFGFFWAVTGVLLFAGAIVFMKLRPHFGDVI